MGFTTNFIAGSEVTISGAISALPTVTVAQRVCATATDSLNASAKTMLTVTGGKVFYCTSIAFAVSTQTGNVQIKDNATVLGLRQCAATGTTLVWTFPVPVPFSHSVVIYASGNVGGTYMEVQGYEV